MSESTSASANAPLVIIGSGPAGLSAAIYTARAGIPTLVLGSTPKVAGEYDIDNYFGFDETISGRDLIERGRRQAERFGAQLREERVLAVHHGDAGGFHVKTDKGTYDACAVVLATGVARVRPGIDNLGDYEGKGVSYCVSCDGFFYRGKQVLVLGEGIFAANQALELTQYTPHVSRGWPVTTALSALCSPTVRKRLPTVCSWPWERHRPSTSPIPWAWSARACSWWPTASSAPTSPASSRRATAPAAFCRSAWPWAKAPRQPVRPLPMPRNSAG